MIKIIMLGSPLFRSLGINTYHLKIILSVKCTVDDRPKRSNLPNHKTKKRWLPEGTGQTILMLFVGGLLSLVFVFIDNLILAHTLFVTSFIIFVLLSITTTFSDILIDLRDHYFIVPRPVNNQTVAAARMLHILIFLSSLIIPLCLPGVMVAFFVEGLANGFLCIAEITIAVIFSVCIVNIFNMIMLRFLSPQRFKDIFAYIQVGLGTIIFGSFYALQLLISHFDLSSIQLSSYKISYFLPPVWFATLQQWTTGQVTHTTYLFTIFAVCTPVICLGVIVQFLSGDYSNKLSMMGASGSNKLSTSRNNSFIHRWPDRMADLFTVSPLEKMGFKLTWKLSSRLNKFKARAYPKFIFMPIILVFTVFNDADKPIAATMHHLAKTPIYILMIYIIMYISETLTSYITQCDQYKAAWIYGLSPTNHPGEILCGTLKALAAKYLMPAAIIATVISLTVWGIGAWLNILCALSLNMMVVVLLAYFRINKFPFSEPLNRKNFKGQFFFIMIFAMIPVVLGYLQMFLSSYYWVLIDGIIISVFITIPVFKSYKRRTWNDLAIT